MYCVSNFTHVVIWDSMKMRIKTSRAGTQQAPIIQIGKSFFNPMGLMNQPLALGSVTSIPFGTTSFYSRIQMLVDKNKNDRKDAIIYQSLKNYLF